MVQSEYLDSNYTIPVLPRMYSSDIYQLDVNPGIRSFRGNQGAPDRSSSLLLYNNKENVKSSRFNAHQLAIPAVQVRILRWLVLGLPGVRGGHTTTKWPRGSLLPAGTKPWQDNDDGSEGNLFQSLTVVPF